MNKYIAIGLLLAVMPATSFAASAPRVSTPRVSTPKVSMPRTSTPKAQTTTPKASTPSYASTPHNNFYYSSLPIWIAIWSVNQNRNNTTTHDHFPYIIVLDKDTKTYQVLRFIGPNNKHERVSPQEEAGLDWLKNEIRF